MSCQESINIKNQLQTNIDWDQQWYEFQIKKKNMIRHIHEDMFLWPREYKDQSASLYTPNKCLKNH